MQVAGSHWSGVVDLAFSAQQQENAQAEGRQRVKSLGSIVVLEQNVQVDQMG